MHGHQQLKVSPVGGAELGVVGWILTRLSVVRMMPLLRNKQSYSIAHQTANKPCLQMS